MDKSFLAILDLYSVLSYSNYDFLGALYDDYDKVLHNSRFCKHWNEYSSSLKSLGQIKEV
jgi:hypothetical protein